MDRQSGTDPGDPGAGIAPPSLLPGRTASHWMRRSRYCLYAGAVLVLLVPAAGAAPAPAQDVVVLLLPMVGLAVCFVGAAAQVGAWRTLARERRAGYTTYGPPPKGGWWLDGEGRVRRPPR